MLSGTAAIGSIIIAGIEYLKIHGLPCISQDQLLGKCKFLSFNEKGALHGFTDLSTLTTQSQEDRLDRYKQIYRKTVSGFLDHFEGIGTFHQRPKVTVKQGIRCTALQDAMMNCGVQISVFQGQGWGIVDVMEKLEEQVYHDVAETALADLETLKGPIETRAALLKSCNLHVKDLIGAISHLPHTVSPLIMPKDDDMENMVGWMPEILENMKEMEDARKADNVEIQRHMDSMEATLSTIVERLHAMQVAQELRNAKEDKKLSVNKEGKI